MSKSNKFFTTILLGAAGGAAAAVFLASKTGQAVKKKVTDFVKDYQDDPDAKHQEWADKATDLKNQAVDRYSDVKQKFESGELSADTLVNTVKEKAADFKDLVKTEAQQAAEDVTESAAEAAEEGPLTEALSEDITIDLPEPAADKADSDNTDHSAAN